MNILPDCERAEFYLRGELHAEWRFTDEQDSPIAKQATRRIEKPRPATVAVGITIKEGSKIP